VAQYIISPTPLYGAKDDDVLFSLSKTGDYYYDVIHGLQGNDTITGGELDDQLYGGNGNDLLDGGDGNDTLDGGADIDTVTYENTPPIGWLGIWVDLAAGRGLRGNEVDTLTGIENVIGTDLIDVIYGDANDNRFEGWGDADGLYGGGGNDLLYGGSGNDLLDGGAGADTLKGGAGIDTVTYEDTPAYYGPPYNDGVSVNLDNGKGFWGANGDIYSGIENITGSAFDDSIRGDGSDNRLEGGAGGDSLDGEGGADKLYGGAGSDGISGGEGADRLYGDGGNDTLRGEEGDDQLYGGENNDKLIGGSGADVFDGGADTDTVSYVGTPPTAGGMGVFVDLELGQGGWGAAGDSFSRIENVNGTDWRDDVIGNDEDNVLVGEKGNDLLRGRGGDDWLVGGDGGDSLQGGDDDDVIDGDGADVTGAGDDDYLEGGSGADIFVFRWPGGSWGDDLIPDFEDGVDHIDFFEVPGLTGWGQLSIVQDGDDVLISFGNSSIEIWGAQVADFSADDFLF
jgi:Ca2+-binding RTX toxin-like protein